MKNCKVLEVTDSGIMVRTEMNEDVFIDGKTLDPFHYLKAGREIQLNDDNTIEYQYSIIRRRDIADHHREEALHGEI